MSRKYILQALFFCSLSVSRLLGSSSEINQELHVEERGFAALSGSTEAFSDEEGAAFGGCDSFELVSALLPEMADKGGGRLWEARSAEYVVDSIICHCMGYDSIEEVTDIFEKWGVSAHYVITSEGRIVNFVSLENAAYHAGASCFGLLDSMPRHPRTGNPTHNYTSFGIEFLAPAYAQGELFSRTQREEDRNWYTFVDFTKAQQEAGLWLIQKLMSDYKIDRHNVLGHSDISPSVKTDPGAAFFWPFLAEHNIGIPLPPVELQGETQTVFGVQQALNAIGYARTPQTGSLDKGTVEAILAFQLHFVPSKFADSNYAVNSFLSPEALLLDACTYGALEYLIQHVPGAAARLEGLANRDL